MSLLVTDLGLLLNFIYLFIYSKYMNVVVRGNDYQQYTTLYKKLGKGPSVYYKKA